MRLNIYFGFLQALVVIIINKEISLYKEKCENVEPAYEQLDDICYHWSQYPPGSA